MLKTISKEQFSNTDGKPVRKKISDVDGHIVLKLPVRNAIPVLANMTIAKVMKGEEPKTVEAISAVLDQVVDYEIPKDVRFVLTETILRSIENM